MDDLATLLTWAVRYSALRPVAAPPGRVRELMERYGGILSDAEAKVIARDVIDRPPREGDGPQWTEVLRWLERRRGR